MKKPPEEYQSRGSGNCDELCTQYITRPPQNQVNSRGNFLPAKYRTRRRDLDLDGIERGEMNDLVRRAVDAVYAGATETATALIACASKQIATGGAK